MHRVRRASLAAMVATLLASVLVPAVAGAVGDEPLVPFSVSFDVTPSTVARSGDTLFVGGAFHRAGIPTGSFVSMDGNGADARIVDPRVGDLDIGNGSVQAMITDGAGGVFVATTEPSSPGGPFVRSIRHVTAAGNVDPMVLHPDDGMVRALVHVPVGTIDQDAHLVVAGTFTGIDGSPRERVAMVNLTTGALDPFDADVVGSAVSAAVVTESGCDGPCIVIGGRFTRAGGARRTSVAQLDLTGAATGWDADITAPRVAEVWDLELGSDDTVYVAGNFSSVNGDVERPLFAQLSLTGAEATAFTAGRLSGSGRAVLVDGTRVLLAGRFADRDGDAVSSVRAVDPTSGAIDRSWSLEAPTSHALGLQTAGDLLLVTTAGDPALVDRETGAASPAALPVHPSAIAAFGTRGGVLLAGTAMLEDARDRRSLAAIDLRDGSLLDFAHDIDGLVSTLAVAGDTLYVGGWFTEVDGAARPGLAAFDIASGDLLPWRPTLDAHVVHDIAVVGGEVIVAGSLREWTTKDEFDVVAFDAVSGAIGSVAMVSDGAVRALAVDAARDRLYLGGAFDFVGAKAERGLWRPAIAAIDLTDGTVEPWSAPDIDGEITAMTIADDVVFVSGTFDRIGEMPRRRAAAFSGDDGTLTRWTPTLDAPASAMASFRGVVYAAGRFTRVNDRAHHGFVAVRVADGLDTAWAADLAHPVGLDLTVSEDAVALTDGLHELDRSTAEPGPTPTAPAAPTATPTVAPTATPATAPTALPTAEPTTEPSTTPRSVGTSESSAPDTASASRPGGGDGWTEPIVTGIRTDGTDVCQNLDGTQTAPPAGTVVVGNTCVGTIRADVIVLSGGADTFDGRGGADKIDVADGVGDDRVRCGDGEDFVLADPGDMIAPDCETVR